MWPRHQINEWACEWVCVCQSVCLSVCLWLAGSLFVSFSTFQVVYSISSFTSQLPEDQKNYHCLLSSCVQVGYKLTLHNHNDVTNDWFVSADVRSSVVSSEWVRTICAEWSWWVGELIFECSRTSLLSCSFCACVCVCRMRRLECSHSKLYVTIAWTSAVELKRTLILCSRSKTSVLLLK